MIVTRELQSDIEHWLGKNKVLIIKGSRQVGKTTLLKQLIELLGKSGQEAVYFSIDQELNNPVFESSKNLFHFLSSQYGLKSRQTKLFLFLDEFQYLSDAGLFLKTLFDQVSDVVQIIVSGSSSLDITKTSEFLTGRKIEFNLMPFNYREFLSYKTKIKFPARLPLADFARVREFYQVYRQYLHEYFLEYISFGGYPEVVLTDMLEDKVAILREIVRTYIDKDIIAFLRIENVKGFQDLLRVLSNQIGCLVNRSELSNTIDLSMETLKKYLALIEGTYLIDLLKPYYTNVRKQVSKMPKVYLNDFGLRNTVLNRVGMLDFVSGSERENFVYSILKCRYGADFVRFYRTVSHAEIDFVLTLSGNNLVPLEVKSWRKKAVLPKIFHSFVKSRGILVTENYLDREGDIYFVPAVLLPFVEI